MYWDGHVVIGKLDRASGGMGEQRFPNCLLKLPLEKRAYLEVAMNHARLGVSVRLLGYMTRSIT